MSTEAPTPADPSPPSRIAFISTGRADAAIYEPLLRHFSAHPPKQPGALVLLAGGTHLSARFGRTIDALPQIPGVEILPVNHHLEGDRPHDVATSAGRAVEAFSKALEQCRPDLVFVLGDRTEMLAAALAATIHSIPIAHLHGGESTAGAYDDACRHAITKLSHIHFAAADEYGRRIQSMNEEPWRIHVVGAPALDQLLDFKPASLDEMRLATGLDFTRPTIVVAFHPETRSTLPVARQIETLVHVLEARSENLLLIGTNADVGHAAIDSAWNALAGRTANRARHVASLTARVYWSCLSRSRALVGNSSSGIIEAPSLGVPVVNIGDRQSGRLRAANVIDAPFDPHAISAAVDRAVSAQFRQSLTELKNPCARGGAAAGIARVIAALPPRATLLRKSPPQGPRVAPANGR